MFSGICAKTNLIRTSSTVCWFKHPTMAPIVIVLAQMLSSMDLVKSNIEHMTWKYRRCLAAPKALYETKVNVW